MTGSRLSLETEPAHLFPKGCAGDAEQGDGFAYFATGLPDCPFDLQTLRALPRLRKACDAIAWMLENGLFREQGVRGQLRHAAGQAERSLEPVAHDLLVPNQTRR
jgi:hypothetical protein